MYDHIRYNREPCPGCGRQIKVTRYSRQFYRHRQVEGPGASFVAGWCPYSWSTPAFGPTYPPGTPRSDRRRTA